MTFCFDLEEQNQAETKFQDNKAEIDSCEVWISLIYRGKKSSRNLCSVWLFFFGFIIDTYECKKVEWLYMDAEIYCPDSFHV